MGNGSPRNALGSDWGKALRIFCCRIVLFTLALSPVWVTAKLISTHAVNTPFGDDWRLVDQLEKLHLSQFSWSELCRPVDGERIPLPQILHLSALRLTGGDVRTDAWMNFTWLAATSFGVLWLLLRTLGSGPGSAILFLIANLALFSPTQDWFAMRESAVILPVACLVWANLAASVPGSTVLKLLTCALLAVTASATGIYGLSLLLTIPVLATCAIGIPCRVRPWIIASTWGLFTLLALRIYFQDFGPPSHGGKWMPPWKQGLAMVFEVLSSPLTDPRSTPPKIKIWVGAALATTLLGLASWTLFTTIARRPPCPGARRAPWLALGGGGLLGIALVAVARLSAGGNFAPPDGGSMIPEPAAIPVLLGAVVPLFLPGRPQRRPRARLLSAALLLLLLGTQATLWVRGTATLQNQYESRLRARVALHLCRIFPPENPLSFGTSDPSTILRRARFLHDEGYLTPLPLNEPFWPDRRVSPRKLPPPDAVITRRELSGVSPDFRIVARIPDDAPNPPHPPAGVVLASRDLADPTRHKLLAIAKPDPKDASAWIATLPAALPRDNEIEFWALDGRDLLAHPLSQVLTAEGTLRERPTELPPPP